MLLTTATSNIQSLRVVRVFESGASWGKKMHPSHASPGMMMAKNTSKHAHDMHTAILMAAIPASGF
jgi:hypothetical protein